MNEFALELGRQREAEGFASARAFYKARGGRTFGCTYKAYLNLEAGRSVPQPALALRIAAALGVSGEAARARAYVGAYLKALVGRPELAGFLLRALGAADSPESRSTPFQRASELGLQEKVVPLTRRQADGLCADADLYWAWGVLSDDEGRWAPAALAKLLQLPAGRTRSALEALVKLGLLRREDGSYFCEDAGKIFRFPRGSLYVPDYRKALRGHWTAMAARRGRSLLRRRIVLRASEAGLRRSFAYLAQAVNGFHIYSTIDPASDTGLFLAQAVVRRQASF